MTWTKGAIFDAKTTHGYSYSVHETLLEVKDVHLTLGGNPILRGVSAQIRNIKREGKEQGQVVGFLGPSGVGKTQLFRILAGLNAADSGEVLITEKRLPVEQGMVGVVAQHYPLFAHRTIWDNLLVAGKQAGMSKDEASEQALSLLRRFKLEDRAANYGAEVSGGQRQRVAIAQQLMCRHDFLLMDEPFSGLDPVMKDETCRLIAEVAGMDELLTIIVVTHDIEAAVHVADTIWLMGRDYVDGKPVPGAYIKEQVNLAEMGLAWHDTWPPSRDGVSDLIVDLRRKFDTL